MKVNLTLDLPEDFQQVCTIFEFQPEEILQTFMNDVSFPIFFCDPTHSRRWATLFFLYNIEETVIEITEEFEYFMDKMASVIQEDEPQAESACRKIMKEWHRAAIAKKSSYLLKNLEKNDGPTLK